MANDIKDIKNEREELKQDLKSAGDDLNVAYEIEPMEVQHLKILLEKTKMLYDNLIRQYNLLKIEQPTEKTREALREIYARKRDDLFIELDYIVSRKDYFTPEEAINILGINEKEFEYELSNNPARLLSIIFNTIDDKSKYILGRIIDKQQPDKMDIETLKQEYVSSTGEFYDKVVNLYFDKLKELNKVYKIESIDNLIKVKPAIDEIIAGLLSLTTILSAGMDLVIGVIRGFDKIIEELDKNKNTLNNEIKVLEKNIKSLEGQKDRLTSELESTRQEYNKETEKLKKLELKIKEMEIRLEANEEVVTKSEQNIMTEEPQLLNDDNNDVV
jgi:hypothetical protein